MALTPLGVESGDDKDGHLSPGRHISSGRWDRRGQNNNSNPKRVLRRREKVLGIHVPGMGGSRTRDLYPPRVMEADQMELLPLLESQE